MNKILLKVSILGSVVFLGALIFLELGYCGTLGWCAGTVKEVLIKSPGYFSFFVATLLITAQSNLYKRAISRSFIYFSIIWILISVLLSQFLGQGHGGWITSSPKPEGIFFLMMVIYLVAGSFLQFILKDK